VKTVTVCALCLVVLSFGTTAGAASKKQAKAISEYCHLCEAAFHISERLVRMLAKHPYEAALAAYAGKVADLNSDLFRRIKPPPGAETIKDHFGKAALAFKKAVLLHKKAQYKLSDEAGKKCVREFMLAIAEVRRLRREGIIP